MLNRTRDRRRVTRTPLTRMAQGWDQVIPGPGPRPPARGRPVITPRRALVPEDLDGAKRRRRTVRQGPAASKEEGQHRVIAEFDGDLHAMAAEILRCRHGLAQIADAIDWMQAGRTVYYNGSRTVLAAEAGPR
jgi:hypothetical protein